MLVETTKTCRRRRTLVGNMPGIVIRGVAQLVCTAVDMMLANWVLESMQKQEKDVDCLSSKHPELCARMIALIPSCAHCARDEYRGMSLIKMLVFPTAKT